ncbi:Kelch domain-containing protein 10 [Bulinus truncatus]|nr:Kelch domain-containing protein 10 [Bulinus truncatus]
MIKTVLSVSHINDPHRDEVDFEPKCTCCPTGRSGHRIIVTDDSLFSLGGFNPALEGSIAQEPSRGHPLFKELWKFNLSTRKWQLVDDFYSVPPTIASHTIAKVGRWLFLFGGTSIPFGETPTSAIYRYDLSAPFRENINCDVFREVDNLQNNKRWHLIPVVGDIPEERYGHTMTMSFPDVYIVGGTSGYFYYSDVFHLDLRSPVGKWTKLSCDGDTGQPVGRYRHETIFDGEILYIFGGGTDEHAFSLVIIHTFNIKSRQWGTLKSLPDPQYGHPTPRKCHSCSQCKNDVFMVGGVSGRNAEQDPVLSSEVWKFSLTNAAWTKYSISLAVPLFFHSADISLPKGCIYIFGGVTRYRNELLRTKRILSIRIAMADLLELAWEVVCHLIGDRWQEADLNELGIPLMLQARVT